VLLELVVWSVAKQVHDGVLKIFELKLSDAQVEMFRGETCNYMIACSVFEVR